MLHSAACKMKYKIYKYLPVIFGCHCRDDRSFYYKGEKFPICARCTGELIGILLAFVTFFFFRLNIKLSLIIMIPMLLDGFIQLLTSYESTNFRRVITGFLFGFGLYTLFAYSNIFVFNFGYNLVR